MATALRTKKHVEKPIEGKICAVCDCSYAPFLADCPRCNTRFTALFDMLAAVRVVSVPDGGIGPDSGGMQREGVTALCTELGIPIVAGELLSGWEITVEQLDEWQAWPARDCFTRVLKKHREE